MTDLISPKKELTFLKAYEPATEEAKIILSANESPFNLPREIVDRLKEELDEFAFNRYPDPLGSKLINEIAASYGLKEGNVVLGNGSDELIEYLAIAYGGPSRAILTFEPTFSMYKIVSSANGLLTIALRRDASFDIDMDGALKEIGRAHPALIFICNPNNPTGNALGLDDIERIAQAAEGALVVVDEAYGEFADFSAIPLLQGYKNLVVLKTFSKAFSLAALRIGYMLAQAEVAQNIQKVRLPFNTDAFSQKAASIVLKERETFNQKIEEIKRSKDELFNELSQAPSIKPFPSKANFILFEVAAAAKVHRALLERGILVRDFAKDPFLKDHLRVTAGSPAENRAFLEALFQIISEAE